MEAPAGLSEQGAFFDPGHNLAGIEENRLVPIQPDLPAGLYLPPGPDLSPGEADADALHRPQLRIVAELVFPALADWQPVLDRLMLSTEARIGLAASADAQRWPLSTQAIASRLATEAEFYEAFARSLKLRFEDRVDPQRLILRDEEAVTLLAARRRGLLARREDRDGPTVFLAAPTSCTVAEFKPSVSTPAMRERLRLVAPSVLRAALWKRAAPLLLRTASHGLFDRYPQMSARFVLNAWQGAAAGAGAMALPAAFFFYPAQTLLAVHLIATLFFMGCVGMRASALRTAAGLPDMLPVADEPVECPVYSVLVALYREESVVPQLVAALSRLDWPSGRLDVKLVCEADDAGTIAAIHRAEPPPFMEIVEVPPSQPRTKPKALNYALPVLNGEFVVLYDAEDRPHPSQLREAWARFRESGPELGCLQAPLVVSNADRSYVARMFGFEYAALFRGLLPHLSQRRLILPLGGTSNHFRRACLERVGGWDPFNVTEDADLSLRMARFGYRIATLSLPTLEDGPESLRTWLPQRARWFKGYCQTWLVHMREPRALYREIGGSRPFLAMQILFAGLLVSALVHPFLVLTFVVLSVSLLRGAVLDAMDVTLMSADVVNVLFSYLCFLALGWRTLNKAERRSFAKVVVGTPFYWMMMSLAAWTALWQLWRHPHHWNKTPHAPARADPLGGLLPTS